MKYFRLIYPPEFKLPKSLVRLKGVSDQQYRKFFRACKFSGQLFNMAVRTSYHRDRTTNRYITTEVPTNIANRKIYLNGKWRKTIYVSRSAGLMRELKERIKENEVNIPGQV